TVKSAEQTTVAPTGVPKPTSAPVRRVTPTPMPKALPTATPTPSPTPAEPENVASKIGEFVSGGSSEEVKKQRSEVHPKDPRQNLLNLNMSSGYFYTNAQSNYWYRDFYSGAPALSVGADVWFTPMLGLSAGYMTTLGADLSAAPGTDEKIVVDH